MTFNLFWCRCNFSLNGANCKKTAVISGPDQLLSARCDPKTVSVIKHEFVTIVGPTMLINLI